MIKGHGNKKPGKAIRSGKPGKSATTSGLKAGSGHESRPKRPVASQKLEITALLPTVEELREPEGTVRFLEGVRETMQMLRGEYRKRLRQEIVRIYAAALVLAEDKDAWSDFCRALEWQSQKKRPGASRQKEALRFTFRFVAGFTKAGVKRASLYFRATEAMFDERMRPEKVLAKLNSSTLSRLAGKKLASDKGIRLAHAADGDTDVAREARSVNGKKPKHTSPASGDEDRNAWVPVKLRHSRLSKELLSFGQNDKVSAVFIIEANDNSGIRGRLTSVRLLKGKDPSRPL